MSWLFVRFRLTLLVQAALLGVGWHFRDAVMAWWLRPFAEGPDAPLFLGTEVPANQVSAVLLASWFLLAPVLASDAWRALSDLLGRASLRRYHVGFALSSWLVALTVGLLTRNWFPESFRPLLALATFG